MLLPGRKTKQVRVDLNIAPLMVPVAHGTHQKKLVVLHETVSPDYAGLTDILGVARYMPSKGLGIHGIIDGEGNLGWDVFGDKHILYHTDSSGSGVPAGAVNTWSIGIELISKVMIDYPDNRRRYEWWWQRDRQIDKCAKVLAYLHRVHGIPLVYSDALRQSDGSPEPGITTHWTVTKAYNVPGGHTDCWPKHMKGYFPVLRFIHRARYFAERGW